MAMVANQINCFFLYSINHDVRFFECSPAGVKVQHLGLYCTSAAAQMDWMLQSMECELNHLHRAAIWHSVQNADVAAFLFISPSSSSFFFLTCHQHPPPTDIDCRQPFMQWLIFFSLQCINTSGDILVQCIDTTEDHRGQERLERNFYLQWWVRWSRWSCRKSGRPSRSTWSPPNPPEWSPAGKKIIFVIISGWNIK